MLGFSFLLIIPMSDHLVLFVDHLERPVPVDPVEQPAQLPSEPSPSPAAVDAASGPSGSTLPVDREVEDCDEEEPLIQMVECRICQEEDSVSNLETPCACSGSLKVLILSFIIFSLSFLSFYCLFNKFEVFFFWRNVL